MIKFGIVYVNREMPIAIDKIIDIFHFQAESFIAEALNDIVGTVKSVFGHGNNEFNREETIMALKFTDMSEGQLWSFLKFLVIAIENHLGEPQNPDDMLDEGREIFTEFEEISREARYEFADGIGENRAEDKTYDALIETLSLMKRFVKDFGGEKWMTTLAVPSRMPRTRPKVRETARAILAAWNEHSADPGVVDIVPAAEKLSVAFDEFVVSFEAQEDYKAKVAAAYRAKKESRKRAEKYIRRVKTRISLHLDPYTHIWEPYGFEPRKRRGKEEDTP